MHAGLGDVTEQSQQSIFYCLQRSCTLLWQVCSHKEGLEARQDLIETWQSDGWAPDKIDATLQVWLCALPLA